MRRFVLLLATVAGLAGLAAPAHAIPAFARRYGTECTHCHEGFPKLSYEGQRFKERGFRLASEKDFDAKEWIRSVPVIVRGSVNLFFTDSGGDDTTTTGFAKAVSAGNLGRRLSYWVDDSLLITEGDDTFTHVKPDNAWARLEIVQREKLYLKAGRIELDLPFTQTRTPHLFSYDVYFANTGSETDSIGAYQDGFEIGGALPKEWRWSAALVKGRNSERAEALSDEAGKFDANVYLRLAKRVGRHRFGGFAYLGRNTLAAAAGGSTLVWDDDLVRLGLDASVWAGSKLNLYGVYLHGRNSNSVATRLRPQGTGEELSFDGGFFQADLHASQHVVLTARFNAVSRPLGVTNSRKGTDTSFFPGVQVFLFKHGKISFEYGFFNDAPATGASRNGYGAVQAEVAF